MKADSLIKKTMFICDKIISAVALVSLLFMLSFVFTWITEGKPSFFGYRIMHVVSESMEPTIMTGDFVLAHTVDGKEVKIGDIVTYKKLDDNGRPTHFTIIHRVVDITDDGLYIFKGDNNPEADLAPVHPNQIGYIVKEKR